MRIPDQRGIVLLSVCIALAIVAAAVFAANREAVVGMHGVNAQIETERARYLAEAGIHHAKWAAQKLGCGAAAFPAVAGSLDGMGSYAATTSTGSGSGQMTVVASGTTSNGARANLTRAGIGSREPASPSSNIRVAEIVAGRDTSIRQDLPTTNFGADALLELGRNTGHALLEFQLPGEMRGGSVLSARLTLYQQTSTGPGTVTVHSVLADWAETAATWTSAGPNIPWKADGGDYSSGAVATSLVFTAGTFYGWDVTAIVDAWVRNDVTPNGLANRGLLLRAANTPDRAAFHSRENANAPRLTIQFLKAC
jgi:hypothetical protein